MTVCHLLQRFQETNISFYKPPQLAFGQLREISCGSNFCKYEYVYLEEKIDR